VLAPVASSYACDPCAVFSHRRAERGGEADFHTGLSYRFIHYESNRRAEGFESLPGQHLESNIWQVYSSYRFTDDVGLQLNIPVLYKDYRRVVNGVVEKGSESGIGDLSVLLNYELFETVHENGASTLTFSAGVKLPTGDSDPLREEVDAFRDSLSRHSSTEGNLVGGDDLANGTGSVDFLLGVVARARKGRWFGESGLQYTFRQEGDFDYEYGDDFFWDIGPGYYLILDEEHVLSVRLKLSGDYKQEDEISGALLVGSGDSTIYAGLEASYSLGSRWYFKGGVDIPLETESSSEEVVPRVRATASAVYRFG
jgi:hypothetical protein